MHLCWTGYAGQADAARVAILWKWNISDDQLTVSDTIYTSCYIRGRGVAGEEVHRGTEVFLWEHRVDRVKAVVGNHLNKVR